MKKILIAIIAIVLSNGIYAQFNENIQTGRPGQAIGPLTVGRYVFQVQSGFDFGGFKEKNIDFKGNNILPNTVVRFGITRHFELNTTWEYRRDRFTIKDSAYSFSGLSNLSVGTRINLYEGKKNIPAIGLQVHLKMPNLSNDYMQEYLAPKIILVATQSFNDKFSATLNLGADYNGNDAQPTGLYVANFGYSISPKVAIFVENYGNFTRSDFEHRWDTGLAWLLNNHLQLDAYGGVGYNNGRTDYFGSVGFSWRTVVLRKVLNK